ncbi:hypothetical protein KFL_004610070 [Klebsormidium nitens]|uniref:Uncharacterized protein n=1 Tax=Klebsormidium nitens TaxID=105231 RepID=A0A1Y1IFK9_KLENI|nr:hypothetical protein KFL_004610070 [Klebsormidium nitens]|eukprot:GAQ88812.1 hypothetical protein KFL_004610070 [Klebsormidium nitens]
MGNTQDGGDLTDLLTPRRLPGGEAAQGDERGRKSERACKRCQGTHLITCAKCNGRGRLSPRGGYHKKNPVSMEKIEGSQWTAMERTLGWRHFRVAGKRRGPEAAAAGGSAAWLVEMVATCDPSARLWINAQNLRDREHWSMGWLQKAELAARTDEDSEAGKVCKACHGSKSVACPACIASRKKLERKEKASNTRNTDLLIGRETKLDTSKAHET